MSRISPHTNPVDDSPLKWIREWEKETGKEWGNLGKLGKLGKKENKQEEEQVKIEEEVYVEIEEDIENEVEKENK